MGVIPVALHENGVKWKGPKKGEGWHSSHGLHDLSHRTDSIQHSALSLSLLKITFT